MRKDAFQLLAVAALAAVSTFASADPANMSANVQIVAPTATLESYVPTSPDGGGAGIDRTMRSSDVLRVLVPWR